MTAQTGLKNTVKVTKIGNSLGVILPKEVVAALKVVKGDQLSVVETADGIELRPHDAQFEKEMAAAEDVIGRYRNTLRELAK